MANLVIKIVLFLILSIVLFLLQDFNFIEFTQWHCSMYQYNSDCAALPDFIFSKLVRLILNTTLILMADRFLLQLFTLKIVYLLFVLMILFFVADIYFAVNGNLFFIRIHNVLYTLLYSPLLLIVYIANVIRIKLL